ncbi:HNH endonuclease [Caulobacter sp.]|uniref:HNH endonuclease n=1 Tax=Caulobacter sp. TaxID=78 RepID=UPI003BA8B905
MSHVYQPLMIRTMLAGGGAATRRQIATAFLGADLSQLEYYEEITKGYPQQTLKRHQLIEHERGVYRLASEAAPSNEWERAALIAVCDAKVADYIARRQDAIWRHRAQNFEPIPGTIRYQVLVRARGRCEACGVSNEVRALQVDHIIPRTAGGSNDLWNFQALCSLCNVQKLNKDATDFHAAHQAFDHRQSGCMLCAPTEGEVFEENELMFAVHDPDPGADRILIAPKRHVIDRFDLWQPEINASWQLESALATKLRASDDSIIGFRIGSGTDRVAGVGVHYRTHLTPVRADGL